jgi:hypothetical protein
VVARWWGPPGDGWPLQEDEPGLVMLAMWRAGATVGFIQFWEGSTTCSGSAATAAELDAVAAALTALDEELLVIRAGDDLAGFVLVAGIGNVDTGIELRRVVATPAGAGIARAALEQHHALLLSLLRDEWAAS